MSSYFPELDYWFKTYWESKGEITVAHVNIPETIPVNEIRENSIFELLFSEVYTYPTLALGLKAVSVKTFPKKVIDRLCVKKTKPTCYISDEDTNITTLYSILELTDEDIDMLNKLYKFKSGVPSGQWYEVLEGLESKLALLIQYYLRMRVEYNFDIIDDIDSLLPFDRDLEYLFSLYVINEAHRYLKMDEIMIESSPHRLRPYRMSFTIDGTSEELLSQFTLTDPIPYNAADVYVYQNGELWDAAVYTVELDNPNTPTSCAVTWDDDLVSLSAGDYFIIDYYTESAVGNT